MNQPRYKSLQLSEEELLERAAKWREWLRSIKLAKSYDIEARENAAKRAITWGHQSIQYFLGDTPVVPGCTEIVLEVLQLHGGRPILPVKIDRLEDIIIRAGRWRFRARRDLWCRVRAHNCHRDRCGLQNAGDCSDKKGCPSCYQKVLQAD